MELKDITLIEKLVKIYTSSTFFYEKINYDLA